jgi:hypothetical protein
MTARRRDAPGQAKAGKHVLFLMKNVFLSQSTGFIENIS